MVLSEIQKYELITKYNSGMSMADISKSMKVNKNTICKWIVRYRETGSLSRKRGSGKFKRINNNNHNNNHNN
jgi:transposase